MNQSYSDSLNCIIKGLQEIVIKEKRCISYTHVSQRYGIRVDLARNILKQFVKNQEDKGLNMSVKFFLCGNCNNENEDEIKNERFIIVDKNELEIKKLQFKNLVVEDIYSVAVIDKDGIAPKLELNFIEYDYELNNELQLKHIQSLTFKRNDNIGFRNIRKRKIPLINVNTSKLEQNDEVNIKSQKISQNFSSISKKIKTNEKIDEKKEHCILNNNKRSKEYNKKLEINKAKKVCLFSDVKKFNLDLTTKNRSVVKNKISKKPIYPNRKQISISSFLKLK